MAEAEARAAIEEVNALKEELARLQEEGGGRRSFWSVHTENNPRAEEGRATLPLSNAIQSEGASRSLLTASRVSREDYAPSLQRHTERGSVMLPAYHAP